MAPVDVIQTEIPEEVLRESLIRTYPKKPLLSTGIPGFFLIICSSVLLSLEIYAYALLHYVRSDTWDDIIIGIIFLLLGIYWLASMVRMPRVGTEKWMKNLRMQTGESGWKLRLQFLEEEALASNMITEEEFHIPYDYIHTIYILDEVMVLATKRGRVNIMRQDIPQETEFTEWLASRCSKVRIKRLEGAGTK